jgi:hypothetical protein
MESLVVDIIVCSVAISGYIRSYKVIHGFKEQYIWRLITIEERGSVNIFICLDIL